MVGLLRNALGLARTGGSALSRLSTPPASSRQEVLAGLVERVTFHNVENGFCILRAKARGHRDLVTVVGHAAVISAGEWITASGDWVNDRTHGLQFKARFMRGSDSDANHSAADAERRRMAARARRERSGKGASDCGADGRR